MHNKHEFTFHCLDFAGSNNYIFCNRLLGQEDYLFYHQIFMSPASIYILVYSLEEYQLKGKDYIAERLMYWLLSIQATSPPGVQSQVIIVGTHADK
jgi:hypothetical protein